MHYKVNININSSSQYIRLQYKGWEGGPFLLTPRGRVWEGASPSHGRDPSEMLVQNTSFLCMKMLKFTYGCLKMNCMIVV